MQKQARPSIGGYLLLLLVPLFWGGAFPAAQHVVTELPPITTAALRFILAGLILLLLLFIKNGWQTVTVKRNWLGLLMMALTGVFAYNVFFYAGLQYTSAINGSLIIAVNPVLTTLGAVLFLKERWNFRLGLGMVLSLGGVLVVITGGSLSTLLTFTFNQGDLFIVVSLLSWVVYGLVGKIVMREVPPLLTTTITTVIGGVFLLLLSLFEKGWGSVPALSLQSWGEMFYMALFATVIAFFLWNKGVHEVGASKASLLINLVPINATWIAVLLYGSPVLWQQYIGMVMVITGVVLAVFQPEKKALVATEA